MDERNLRFFQRFTAKEYAKATGLREASLQRQIRTTHAILRQLARGAPGLLLADDVGLGKTTIGALVALVYATAGNSVRILAPNKVVKQRWRDELAKHRKPLAQWIRLKDTKIREDAQRLRRKSITVTTHFDARMNGARGDLLIVDEAHRSKSSPRRGLRRVIGSAVKQGAQVLLVTATPMSIDAKELGGILRLLQSEKAADAVEAYGKEIAEIHQRGFDGDANAIRKSLIAAADRATKTLEGVVFRHCVSDLKRAEQRTIGSIEPWRLPAVRADEKEIELLVRADRALRLARQRGALTNDPRFHVSRRTLEKEMGRLSRRSLADPGVALHLGCIEQSGLLQEPHPKAVAVARAIADEVGGGEKVVVFCHHHDVAAEFSEVLRKQVREHPKAPIADDVWRDAWRTVFKRQLASQVRSVQRAAENMIQWFCEPTIRNQVSSWLPVRSCGYADAIVDALRRVSVPRGPRQRIAKAAISLFEGLSEDRSSSAFSALRLGRHIEDTGRVLSLHDSEDERAAARPDLALTLFNSPFGPDVLVVTDRFAEAIDLHRSCRLLVHYELDPSPMRTIQREGRVRRVNSWAGVCDKPIRYAMPMFAGTRDEKLVRIMEHRRRAFGLLLGGVRPVSEEEIDDASQARLGAVLDETTMKKLASFNRRLVPSVRQ